MGKNNIQMENVPNDLAKDISSLSDACSLGDTMLLRVKCEKKEVKFWKFWKFSVSDCPKDNIYVYIYLVFSHLINIFPQNVFHFLHSTYIKAGT